MGAPTASKQAPQLLHLQRHFPDGDLAVSSTRLCANAVCHTLRIPWCTKVLEWKVLRDLAVPNSPPDVVFDDPSFTPLPYGAASAASGAAGANEHQQQLLELLGAWPACSSEADALSRLLQPLLALYGAHQRWRLAQLHDERLQFELSMLDATGCSELLLTDARDASDRRACFALLVEDIDMACVRAAWCYLQPQPNDVTASGSSKATAKVQAGTGADVHIPGRFKLHVAFRLGASAAHTTPELHLQGPPWFTAHFSPLQMPAWNPQAPLLEFVPAVAQQLQQHLQHQCQALVARARLIEELATHIGQPLEVNVSALQYQRQQQQQPQQRSARPPSSRASGSGMAATAAFHLVVEQQPVLLLVELPAGFPADQPVLTLQSVRHVEGTLVFRNYPWSPRWPAEEMAARVYNYLKEECTAAASRLTSG